MRKEKSWQMKLTAYMLSQTISMLGSSIVSLAMIWHVTLQTNSGISIAGITITTFLPQALIMLAGGVIADRFSMKKIIILSDIFIAGATLCLAILYFLGYQSILWIYIFNTFRSLGTGIQLPASKSILPLFIPEDELLRANSYSTTIWSVIQLISPGLGGLALTMLPLGEVFLIDVVTALIGVSLLSTISIQETEQKVAENSIREMKKGFQYLSRSKTLKSILILYTVFQFLVVPASQLTPLLASNNLGEKVWILSVIEIAFSVGALVSSLVMGYKKIKISHFKLIGCSAFLFGLMMILVVISKQVHLFLVSMFVMGIGSPLYYTPLITIIQKETQLEYMGRVFSYVDLLGTLATPCGMFIFGPLSSINLSSAFIIPGLFLAFLGGSILIKKETILSNKSDRID
ncbi:MULTISPECIES: MFS transporter [unclassified Clostridioides]|uniref:MFS transporter n=1 Tax=unclassified Clostridioides TaxID=2635829 RepID=UPI001D126EED|nr:MFS transporter [Clostridioides sp. ZZV14-6154]MCC0720218.1 MFS transporter [Clostridioides sp. ZZV14-6105]MCC0728161.1 MFS transporter [Clostridioides sp. ZZV14-6045]MCC0732578.1 MFS transporter [Clostridioides sp. ZZV14-6048]MCC0736539.1 MFS transporter [Clostridioides sp. ZZV14-6009]MCC0740509.1 MFS transporter [Clostridioides sp. ZZV14-5902]WLD26271.1 Enterobactin exporter EntS [Clostridioides difficile]